LLFYYGMVCGLQPGETSCWTESIAPNRGNDDEVEMDRRSLGEITLIARREYEKTGPGIDAGSFIKYGLFRPRADGTCQI
jgi:hypothetical protein